MAKLPLMASRIQYSQSSPKAMSRRNTPAAAMASRRIRRWPPLANRLISRSRLEDVARGNRPRLHPQRTRARLRVFRHEGIRAVGGARASTIERVGKARKGVGRQPVIGVEEEQRVRVRLGDAPVPRRGDPRVRLPHHSDPRVGEPRRDLGGSVRWIRRPPRASPSPCGTGRSRIGSRLRCRARRYTPG